MTPTMARGLLFALFAISGFSGLIYESIWARYLKLFLGHAAYSQTLVLVIFMGGMAIGAWLAARYSPRWRNLLLGYAIVEVLIGLCGAGFHPLFVATMGFAFDSVIPLLGSAFLVQCFKWGLAALLILPQSILLGATFPLMSAAVVRRFPDAVGSNIATLYFTNSLGAAFGVLAAGFVMLAAVGLPGTILSAGLINVGVALVVWLIGRNPDWNSGPAPEGAEPMSILRGGRPMAPPELATFLVLAGVTGTASFMYEIGWIRMLGLVMGASTHAFELMLSAFILGLAFGSFWIRHRIGHLRDPVIFLGTVQVVMGALALGTLAVYGSTFAWMSTLLGILTKSDAGYVVFNVASHTIALLVMVPTTFCAGMTLPLITQILLRRGHGEASIGHVYAANTLGAIAGVAIAVHLAMPLAGLKGVIITGAAMDIGIGIYIVYGLTQWKSWLRPSLAASGGAVLLAAGVFAELDVDRMSGGVFRHGRVVEPDAEVIFHRDGKTATVNVTRYGSSLLALRTNGKADASINMNPEAARSTDEHTQVLLAALPIGARPDARDAAVIGFGSGLTTHVLLGSPNLEHVTTVEIEPVMIEGARYFLPRVKRAFEDPRSIIRIEDAKTFFASANQQYDLIISEPSNPWVSGVAGLFSREFYALAKRFLRADGVFCQWLHTYEIDPPLAASVMLALQESFPYYEIYNTNDVDILILASDRPIEVDIDYLLKTPAIAEELATISMRNPSDLHALRVGSEALMGPLFRSFVAKANSDYYPVLDLGAVRTRFLGVDASSYANIARAAVPLIEMLDPRAPILSDVTANTGNPEVQRAGSARFAMAVRDFIAEPDFAASTVPFTDKGKRTLLSMLAGWQRCGGPGEDDFWIDNLLTFAEMTVPFLSSAELDAMWNTMQANTCKGLESADRVAWLQLVRDVSARHARAMLAGARKLLSATENTENGRRKRYLVTVAMTAALANDDAATAKSVWRTHGSSLMANGNPPIELRLLIAQMAERLINEEVLASAGG